MIEGIKRAVCSKQVAIWSLDFSKILATLTRLVGVSIQVRAENFTIHYVVLMLAMDL